MKTMKELMLGLLAVSAFLWLNIGLAALVGHFANG
jgi:hypothetical protein